MNDTIENSFFQVKQKIDDKQIKIINYRVVDILKMSSIMNKETNLFSETKIYMKNGDIISNIDETDYMKINNDFLNIVFRAEKFVDVISEI